MNKLKKIEEGILLKYIELYPLFSKSFRSQINAITYIEREFTGSGVFVSFTFDNSKCITVNKKLFMDYDRIGAVSLKSNELLHDCTVSVKLYDNGIIDYIEFESGFIKKEYPNNYTISEAIINFIKDEEGI